MDARIRSRKITFQLTWRCNIRCSHCCQDHLNVDLSRTHCEELIDGFAARKLIDRVGFTGGEVFLRYDDLSLLIRRCGQLGLSSTIITNAQWARSPEVTYAKLAPLIANGLALVAVSYDAYHASFVSVGQIVTALQTAAHLGAECMLFATSGSKDTARHTTEFISAITAQCDVPVKYQTLTPIGHGKDIAPSSDYYALDKLSLTCPTHLVCNVWADGRVLPCCMAGTHEKLSVGRYPQQSVDTIIKRLENWTLLKTLRSSGLIGALHALPEDLQKRFVTRRFVSPCHLCHSLLSDEEVAQRLLDMDYRDLDFIEHLFLESAYRQRAVPHTA